MKILLLLAVCVVAASTAMADRQVVLTPDSRVHILGDRAVVSVDIETDVPVRGLAFDIFYGRAILTESLPITEDSMFSLVTERTLDRYECSVPGSSGFAGWSHVTTLTFLCTAVGEVAVDLSRFSAYGPDYHGVEGFRQSDPVWIRVEPVPELQSIVVLAVGFVAWLELARHRT